MERLARSDRRLLWGELRTYATRSDAASRWVWVMEGSRNVKEL
jgi:hypothetical protein